MNQLKLIFLLTNVLIWSLSAQSESVVHSKDSTRLAFSLTPYSITSEDIKYLSDTITAKMSWLYGLWYKQENPFSPSTQIFRLYLPASDSAILFVNDAKGNAFGNPFSKFVNKGYYTVRVDIFKASGIFKLTAKYCDSTFARNMIFIK